MKSVRIFFLREKELKALRSNKSSISCSWRFLNEFRIYVYAVLRVPIVKHKYGGGKVEVTGKRSFRNEVAFLIDIEVVFLNKRTSL